MRQNIYDFIPVLVGFVAFITIRIVYGPISMANDPGYTSFLLILVSVLGFVCVLVGKKRKPEGIFVRHIVSSVILMILGVLFLCRSMGII